MNKLICYCTVLSLIVPSFSLASSGEDQFIAGVSITKSGPKLYLEYKDEEDKYKQMERTKSASEDLEMQATQEYFDYKKNKQLNYSGYRNVEGYRNNKRRDDWTFASIFAGTGLLIVAAGAVTVTALINALDD